MNREPDSLDPFWAIGPCHYCGDDAADYDDNDRLTCRACYRCAQAREAYLDADLRNDECTDTPPRGGGLTRLPHMADNRPTRNP